MRQFLLPDLGMGNKDAEIVAWHVAVGDHVGVDDPLVSVETEKATIEIPSPWSGRIDRLCAGNGDLVKVGAPLVEFADGIEETAARSASRLTATVRNVRRAAPSAPSAAAIRQFALPDLGIGDKEAQIIAWHVGVGDHIGADEPLVSIETDKATIELPSPWGGRVTRVLADTGDMVKVGAQLVEIAEGAAGHASNGTAPEFEVPPAPQPAPPAPRAAARAPAPAPRAEPARTPAPQPQRAVTPAPAPAKATPAPAPAPAKPRARAPVPAPAQAPAAADLPVNPNRVEPTGPGGTVTPADVQRAARRLADEDASWGEVKELPAEGSHLALAVALVVIVIAGLFLAWWLDPLG
jgi:pyruvate/2-oxoglutarate dehydrogenase complex dihydrolipoamide acyltransferase (E2) component